MFISSSPTRAPSRAQYVSVSMLWVGLFLLLLTTMMVLAFMPVNTEKLPDPDPTTDVFMKIAARRRARKAGKK